MEPPRHDCHPDLVIDCEMMLEAEFAALAERAEAAGWPAHIVAGALVGLARARRQMLAANEATDAAIAIAGPGRTIG